MEKSQPERSFIPGEPEIQDGVTIQSTRDGELIALDDLDPALAAKLRLLNDVSDQRPPYDN